MRHQSMKFARPTLRCHSINTLMGIIITNTHRGRESEIWQLQSHNNFTNFAYLESKPAQVQVLCCFNISFGFFADLKTPLTKWPSELLIFGVFPCFSSTLVLPDVLTLVGLTHTFLWQHGDLGPDICPGPAGATGTAGSSSLDQAP